MIQRVVAMVAVLLMSTAALSAPSPSGSESGWWEDTPWRNPDRGFNWYPPDTPPKKADKKAADKPKPIKDMKTMEELQKELARLKDLAIMQPTQANVRSYLEAQTLAELSRDFGLMFFFRSDCPYCHQQAPVLRLLEQQYGMPVMGVSMDGGGLPQFPDARRDNGISMIVSGGQGIQTVPALFLVHRETRQAVPIGTGALAIDEIVERIRVLTRTRPGQEF